MKISTNGHAKVTFRIAEEPIRRAEPLFSPVAAEIFKACFRIAARKGLPCTIVPEEVRAEMERR